jgi:drug/metabolite transporter (DMT)-like permease
VTDAADRLPGPDQTPTPADREAGVLMSAVGDTATPRAGAPPARSGAFARRPAVFERRAAEAACVGVMVLWAANFVVVKSTIPVITPVGYAFIRFAVAGMVLLAICRWREGSVAIPRRDIVPLAGLGLLGFGLYQMLWSTALESTSVGNSALLIGATPVFTALVAAALRVDTLSRTKAVGVTVAFVGVAVVAAGHGLSLDSAALGDLLTLLAAFSWAAYVSFGAGVLRRFSPLRATAWTITFGAAFLAPVGLWQLTGVDVARIGPAQIAAVAYSGLLSSALGNVVVFWGISLLGPTRITNLQFLPPALAIVFAAIFLGDPILASQLIGGAIIVVGVLLARRDRTARRAAA